MGSTGETDRKRRLSSPFAPGAAAVAPAKRPALPPCSDDKKLDFAVLKYRNQKLSEQLEVNKFEYRALEGKFDDLKQRQKAHNETLDLVNKSWKHLVRDLEVTSVCKSGSQNSACSTDGARISQDKDFLSRLIGTGATESSGCHLGKHVPLVQSSAVDVLQNVLLSSNDSWHAIKKISLALFSALPENECSRQLRIAANELSLELNDAIEAISDLHFRQLTENYHNQRYSNARSKAEQKHLKGVKVKQAQDALHLEIRTLHRNLQQANSMMDLYDETIDHLVDKLKVWSEQVGKLAEDGWRVSLGNAQRKLVDVQGEAQQLRQSMDHIQAKVGRSRSEVAELLIESEKERRIEDDLELMSRKASSLRAKAEGSAVLEKFHQEVKVYRGILKCALCRERRKEVVIAKCYHLFCSDCIHKSLRNRQRRCPSCGLSFGGNDVKPIYI